MSKINVRLPNEYNRQTFEGIFQDIATQLNSVSEGRLAGTYNAQTAKPVTGTHAKGDVVRNSNPETLGVAPNQFVVYGWICVSSGTPGTWSECRFQVGSETAAPAAGSITFTGAAPTKS